MGDAPAPWLTVVGIGEDGPAGLPDASRAALQRAEILFGAPRHLALLADPPCNRLCEARAWPVPFEAGIPALLAERGRRVVLLVSGDPFWFGAGGTLMAWLSTGEWVAHPVPSTFSMAASRLGWRLEEVRCVGLHAAPLARLRPLLAPGARVLALMRDGLAVGALANYLAEQNFGASKLWVLEALGGPRERIRAVRADMFDLSDATHPVAVGMVVAGEGAVLPRASGVANDWFAHDGQISKPAIRALALSALAPRAGERLWDVGAGAGSIGIEWLLADAAAQATAFERDATRAARVRANAAMLGCDRLRVVEGAVPDALANQPTPDAVFIGGGLSEALLDRLEASLPAGTRLVAHAVTLESEALLARWHGRKGGALARIELAEAAAIGSRRAWRASFPLVQWSVRW